MGQYLLLRSEQGKYKGLEHSSVRTATIPLAVNVTEPVCFMWPLERSVVTGEVTRMKSH